MICVVAMRVSAAICSQFIAAVIEIGAIRNDIFWLEEGLPLISDLI
jgi:hypothetical protein